MSFKIKKYFHILIFFLLSLIPLIFYYNLFKLNLPYFDPNIILQKNFIWDEQTSYFLKSQSLIKNFNFDVNEIDDSFKLNSTIIPLLIITIFQIIFGYSYFTIFLDLITSFVFLITIYYVFKKYFGFSKIQSIIYLIFFFIFFSKGPTTISFYNSLFINFELISMPHIFRQISPSLTTIFFGLYLWSVYEFFLGQNSKKKLILIFLSYFVYPYSSLIQIIFAFLIVLFFLKKKINSKKIYLFLTVNLLSFLLWFIINRFESQWFSKFLLGANYELFFDFRNFITLTFIIINFFIYKFLKKELFLVINILYLSFLIIYNLKFVIGYDLQFYHVDIYFIKPTQWLNIFFILKFIKNKKFDQFLIFFSILIVFLFCLSFNNYSKKILSKNFELLKQQLIYKKELKKIDNYLQHKTVVTLDPNFIFFGFNITDSKNYLFYSARNIKIDPKENLSRFIITCHIHGIKNFEQIYDLYKSNTKYYSYGKHGFFHEIIFLEDGNAGGLTKPYRSLFRDEKNISDLDVRSFMLKLHLKFLRDNPINIENGIILIDKKNSTYKSYNIDNKLLILDNDFFKIYKINA